jgi:hypothetical protein
MKGNDEMQNKVLAIALLAFLIGLLPIASRGQSDIYKCSKQDSLSLTGYDFSRFHPDSLVFISYNLMPPLNLFVGFDVFITDKNLNQSLKKRYFLSGLWGFQISSSDSDAFVVVGNKVDTVYFAQWGFNIRQKGATVFKLDHNLDTLWSRVYFSNDTLTSMSFQHIGTTNDTLIFSGILEKDSAIYDDCGLLVYINSNNGNLIDAFSYCDSTYSIDFLRYIVDTNDRNIHIALERNLRDGTGFPQVVYAQFNYSGDNLSCILISDTAAISNSTQGAFIRNPSNKSMMIAYRTIKYNLGNAYYEVVLLDSLNQLLNCKYRPNFNSSGIPLNYAERIDGATGYRFWSDNYYIDVDDSLNYLDGKWVLLGMPAYRYFSYKFKTFSDGIYGLGVVVPGTFSTGRSLYMKNENNSNSCYASPLNISWNLQSRSLTMTPLTIHKNSYLLNLNVRPQTFMQSLLPLNDSAYCIASTGMNNEQSSSFQLKPNPAQEWIFISGLSPQTYTLYISDLFGRTLYTTSITVGNDFDETSINVSHLPEKQLYLITCYDESKNKQYSTKLLKL